MTSENIDEAVQGELCLPEEVRVIVDPSDPQMQFVHSNFASVSLPRAKVDKPVYEYSYEGARISIESGRLFDGENFVQQSVPYGATARLIIFYISTYATQRRTRHIPLCESLTDFVRTIRGNAVGGPRGTIQPTITQLAALAACKISCGVNIWADNRLIPRTTKIEFAGQFEGGFTAKNWPRELVINQDFYESLSHHALPLDMRALQLVAGSALAMDLLTYFAHRLPRAKAEGEVLSWALLRRQFDMADYDPTSFRRFFLTQLRSVMAAYPAARVERVNGGLFVKQSQPLVQRVIALPSPRNRRAA